ncbi:MAG TPA: hypothetical protein DEB06_07075 [Phycisphaerales bacterium]|nr:hypothetical protein [Phycisphaerales bacterium]
MLASFFVCPWFVHALPDNADEIVNPWSASSPSGEFVLRVDPSKTDGSGPARYTMLQRGRVLWKAEHPFTLREGAVTDKGEAAGYAYSHGKDGRWSKDDEPSTLNAIILNQLGMIRLNDARQRHHPEVWANPPAPFEPTAHGVLVSTEADRLVVRTGQIRERGHKWWVYRLSTGERLGDVNPLGFMGNIVGVDENLGSNVELRCEPIPGTPLVAVQWMLRSYRPIATSACFSVQTLNGEAVWSSVIHDEWTKWDQIGNSWPELRLEPLRQLWTEERELWIASRISRQRLNLRVEADEAAPLGWRVEVVGEEPWTPAAVSSPSVRDLRRLPLERNGTIRLEMDDPAGERTRQPTVRVSAIATSRQGLIFAQDEQDGRVVVMDSTGTRIRVLAPRSEDFVRTVIGSGITVLGDGTVWIGKHEGFDHIGFLRFDPVGVFVGVDRLFNKFGRSERWHGQPASDRRWVESLGESLKLVAADGSITRRITHQPDGGWLVVSRSNLGVGPDGSVVASSQSALHLYSADGDPVLSIPRWRSQAHIGRDDCRDLATNGRWVASLEDAGIVLYDAQHPERGAVLGVESPIIREGNPFHRALIVSPDGRELWALRHDPISLDRYRFPE